METITRRQAIRLIGIGIGTAHAISPASLLAQTRDRLLIGTAGKAVCSTHWVTPWRTSSKSRKARWV